MEDAGRKRSRSRSISSRKHRDKEPKDQCILNELSDLVVLTDSELEESVEGGVLDDDNEPTIGEQLEILKLMEIEKKDEGMKEDSTAPPAPPTADSVHILLKQALCADDRVMLLDCIYNQDDKVITKSVSLLNSADVMKLFNSLLNLIHSRGAVLACALPWLKNLLLRHATGIMSHEYSPIALNSLYQLIDSRIASYRSAMKVSSCLDFLYAGIVDEGMDEEPQIIPVVYEDRSESDEPDDTETDKEENGNREGEISERISSKPCHVRLKA